MALQLHNNVSLNRPADRTRRRPPGRPRNNRLDQLRNDSTHPSDWRALEVCCRPWTWWCNDATALAGYATMMMMMMCVCVIAALIRVCWRKQPWNCAGVSSSTTLWLATSRRLCACSSYAPTSSKSPPSATSEWQQRIAITGKEYLSPEFWELLSVCHCHLCQICVVANLLGTNQRHDLHNTVQQSWDNRMIMSKLLSICDIHLIYKHRTKDARLFLRTTQLQNCRIVGDSVCISLRYSWEKC